MVYRVEQNPGFLACPEANRVREENIAKDKNVHFVRRLGFTFDIIVLRSSNE